MPRSGVGDMFSGLETNFQPAAIQPDWQDTWNALFREGANFTLGRQGLDRWYLENEGKEFGGERISLQEAQEKYGMDFGAELKLKNSSGFISNNMAYYLYRKKFQSMLDQETIRVGQPDPITQFAAGTAASLTDPAEFALSAFLPITRLGAIAETSLRAGRFVKPATVARFLARNPAASVLERPFLAGVVEGAGSTALMAPIILNNAAALGQEYTLDDALMDVAVSGAAGGVIQAAPHALKAALGISRREPKAAANVLPVEPKRANLSASADFANGKAVQVEKTIDRTQAITELDAQRKKVVDVVRRMEDETPERMQQIEFNDPEVSKHLTPLEQRILMATDPEAFRTILSEHLDEITSAKAKLAEILSNKPENLLDSLDDALEMQSRISDGLVALNAILPENEAVPSKFTIFEDGAFNKKALIDLGKEIERLNNLAVRDMDDGQRIALLKSEHERLNKQLTKAMAALKQAQTKAETGSGTGRTIPARQAAVDALVPQLEHVTRLLQAWGENVTSPALSLNAYVDSLQGNIPPELASLLKFEPELGKEPLYRVRKQIIDNMMSRIQATKDYVNNLDLTDPNLPKYPQNAKILEEVRHYLESPIEGGADPARLQEALLQGIDQQINEVKRLGIMDEKGLARLDKINEMFKEEQIQTKAWSDGAFQAQLCALQGVTED